MDTMPAWLRPLIISLIFLGAVVLIGGIIWWVTHRPVAGGKEQPVEQVSLITTDSVTLIGDLYRPSGTPKGAVLMLHMLPATRASWKNFATALANRGYLGLAIDLRGHGDSTLRDGQPLNYQNFSDAEHQSSRLDVMAALNYLETIQKISRHQIGLVGASIGANLALEAQANDRQILWTVLLSPGLDYHGIVTQSPIQNIAPPQRLLLIASDDDVYSFQTIDRLGQITPATSTSVKLSGAGHGTTMLERHSQLPDQVLSWIESNTLNR